MTAIPAQRTTQLLIETTEIVGEKERGYLGMSGIGDACERKLWYGFHFATSKRPTEPRIQRIFNLGDYTEEAIIAELKRIGCEVYRYEDGEKIELKGFRGEKQDQCVAVAGHFKGHTDGNVMGVVEAPKTEHLLEAKSHNDKNFKALKKSGVRKSFPKHYAQMQCYMKYRKLKRALYVAMNKNDCEIYIERVYYDSDDAAEYEAKAQRIILSVEPPPKAFDRNWHECKYRCDHYDICHNDVGPAKNCRTCSEVDICDNGKWECGMDGKELSIQDQMNGCEYYSKGWML